MWTRRRQKNWQSLPTPLRSECVESRTFDVFQRGSRISRLYHSSCHIRIWAVRRMRDTFQRIWKVVDQIPRGRVATYGQVAREAGFPGNARLVGYALHALPEQSKVPWQRVLNSRGEISFPKGSRSYLRQSRLLKKEKVVFKRGKTDLLRFGWFGQIKTR
jgi:methylated-DNA-protein-cysteine methyltransferase-like protein